MRKDICFSLFLVSLVLISACRPQQAQDLPTLAATLPPVAAPSATEAAAPTTIEQPTTAPSNALPPTWTPTDLPTATIDPSTPTPSPTVFFPQQRTECESFQVDRQNSTVNFPITAQPTVAWMAVAGAGQYRLQVYGPDERGNFVQIYENYTAQTRLALPADLFELGVQYGWDVYPIGADGNQMCIAVGNELTPIR